MQGRPNPPPSSSRQARRIEHLGLVLIAAAIIGFYAYLAGSHAAKPWQLNKGSVDYYSYLVDGFLSGQLAMKVDPDPGLATLSNPYDPGQRAQSGHPGWHDVTYYKGRYYLYFGVAPALTLFLPFRVLTGLHLSEIMASVIFCAGGYLSSLALFLGLRRKYFPGTSRVVVWLGALMLGLGNFCTVMLTRSQFYEVPIASAYFFSCLGLALLSRAICQRPLQRRWLWLGSAAFGLAVASRPHFVFATAGVALVWWWWWRERRRVGQDHLLRAVIGDGLAVAVPVALTLAGLFAYNYLRFGSIFEFGQKYQLAGSNQVNMKLLDWRSVPANFYYYFLAPAQFGRYFPFFEIIRDYPGALSKYYYGIEDPYGLLTNMPCFWMALLAPLVWWKRRREQRELGVLMLLWGVSFGVICVFTLFFVSATNRYMVDFLPSSLLLASLGLLLLAEAWESSRPVRRVGRAILAGLIIYTAFFNVMVAFQHNGLFRHHQPAAFNRIAYWFNFPASVWERITGYQPGPVELTVRLPSDKLGTTEPLVATGTAIRSDYVYVFYTGAGKVQIGFTHLNDPSGIAGVMTQPIPVDYNVPHRITIQSGSLYPPEGHAYFSKWTPEAVRTAKHTLSIMVDGVPYLNAPQAFYDTTPAYTSFGRNPISGFGGRKFTGELLGVRRTALIPPLQPFTGGAFVRLAVILPKGKAGQREPLIATGRAGAGDLLFVTYEDEAHLRLGFVHTGSEPLLSEPLAFVPGEIQMLEVSLGSFYPPSQALGSHELANALIVKFNRQLIWAREQSFYPVGETVPVFGVNEAINELCAGRFSGETIARQALPTTVTPEPYGFAPYWIVGGPGPSYGPLRLKLSLPTDQAGKFQPLLVTGPSVGQADYVWIQYHDATRATIGYENTGGGGPRGLAMIDYTRPVVVEISIPSLYPPEEDPYFAGRSLLEIAAEKNRARITVNGVTLIDERVKSHPSTPAQVTPLENRLTTTFGTRFTGRIMRVERLTHAQPLGFSEQQGPLEIDLSWPSHSAGGHETLFATGPEGNEDVLSVTYENETQVRFGVKTGEAQDLVSETVRVVPGARQKVRIAWGGLYLDDLRPKAVPRQTWGRWKKGVTVWLDGKVVLEGTREFRVAKPQNVRIGSGGSAVASFSGQIYHLHRIPAP